MYYPRIVFCCVVQQVAEWGGDFVGSFVGLQTDLCVYGNWCGGGCSGLNGDPIDDVDAHCKVHDQCYESTDTCELCKCDADLIAQMDQVRQRLDCNIVGRTAEHGRRGCVLSACSCRCQ